MKALQSYSHARYQGECGEQKTVIDPDRFFYVTVCNGTRSACLLGPYELHETALALVDQANGLALKHDVNAPFYSYGTASILRSTPNLPVGGFNSHIESPVIATNQ